MYTFPFTKYFVNVHGTPNYMKLLSHESAVLKLFGLILNMTCCLLYRGNGSSFQLFSCVFFFVLWSMWTRDSAVGVAIGYGLEGRGVEVQVPVGILFLPTSSSPALGPTQPPIQWVPLALSPRVKRPGREADSPPDSSEFSNTWVYTSP
jgi:hypothetical protein